MKIKTLVFSLLIIGFGGLIAYRISSNSNKKEGPKDKKDKETLVSGIVVRPESFDTTLSLSGSLEANEIIELHSEVSGIVEGIYFQEGTNVSKGQLLLKVNDVELRAQLAQANTKEALAAENERRAKLLLQKEAISQEEYDIAKADHKSAQAQSQLIKAQISKTSVRAPFAGKIGLRSISAGTYITPTVAVAKLVNSSKLKVTFAVPEKYVSQVKNNTVLSFTVDGNNDKFVAKVYAIEPEVAVETRTLKVRAITENSHGKLLPGTFANVVLPLHSVKAAIVVPTEAIIPIQDGKKVYISKNGMAKEVKVATSTRTDATVLVLSGLKVGDTVLTSGVMSLKDSTKVKVNIKKDRF